MDLNIEMEGDIVQNETKLNLMNENTINTLKKHFEEALKERISDTLEKLQKEFKADVIDAGKSFHQFYPGAWSKAKGEWDEKFSQVEMNINIRAKVRRPGYIGPPAGIPNDEVEQ